MYLDWEAPDMTEQERAALEEHIGGLMSEQNARLIQKELEQTKDVHWTSVWVEYKVNKGSYEIAIYGDYSCCYRATKDGRPAIARIRLDLDTVLTDVNDIRTHIDTILAYDLDDGVMGYDTWTRREDALHV